MDSATHVISDLWQWLSIAAAGKWMGIYMRVLAGILLYGATVHVGNILGLGGQPWLSTPLLWRVLDVVLLVFDIAVGIGLWLKQLWAIVAAIAGILLLQTVPYTLFRSAFIQTPADVQTLNGLVGTELLLLAGLVGLAIAQK